MPAKKLQQRLKYVPAYEIKRHYKKATEEKGTEKGGKNGIRK